MKLSICFVDWVLLGKGAECKRLEHTWSANDDVGYISLQLSAERSGSPLPPNPLEISTFIKYNKTNY